jgi:death-on-curing protein
MPIWLKETELRYFHHEQLVEHGGLRGVHDEGALESTLARPLQLLNYEPETTLPELAACYGYGFARNHVFADGNKRIALVTIDLFLMLNGYTLTAGEEESVVIINEVANGEMNQQELAKWIEQNSRPFDLDKE